MSKEYLEAFKTIKIKCHPNSNPSPLVDSALDVVEQALHRLEAIDNANPSEALECLEVIEQDIKDRVILAEDRQLKLCVVIKQALLKVQVNARSEEILQKYYQEGITLDSVRALKLRIEALEKDLEEQRELAKYYLEELEKENTELRLKEQEPKHYLKWEDLEFDDEWKYQEVKLNGTKYTIKYKCGFDFFDNYYEVVKIYNKDKRKQLFTLYNNEQFFNDLHLERAEENESK